MKIRFKELQYQLDSVQAVVDCFRDQPYQSPLLYQKDLGRQTETQMSLLAGIEVDEELGFANAPISDLGQVLKNIKRVQARHFIPESTSLVVDDTGKNQNLTKSPLNLNIEMETGTGKTYCYIRTMFELYKHYGWSKFIVVVPSIAIREGVQKSLSMMAEHFQEIYGHKARFFTYNSSALHQLESFSSDAGLNIMVINVQAFNSRSRDNLRIYDELDEFQSRKPIDVISRNRPILILDEPQKMGSAGILTSLSNFNPLFILRYSATHKRDYNLIYRLDALDAYNQKLVKKITVKGIEVQGLSGAHSYLYLQDIIVSTKAPVARLELEIKHQQGFRREVRKISKGDNLYDLSKEADQYKDGYVVVDIDARDNSVSFVNGKVIHVGEAMGHVDEEVIRTIQIRETIRAHIQKEQQLFRQGIKVLSLFFIDEVAKYRQYDEDNNRVDGEYAVIFKEQYQQVLNEMIGLDLEDDGYHNYLNSIDVDSTHNGYFAIDKRTNNLVDPKTSGLRDEVLGVSVREANDADAYDLILKDKERLLSFDEPTRFIFSHSALREGWDNPNVFVICTLKHSDNVISRRQEVGRGMRLAVNKDGERMDANYFQGAMGEIHKLNNLTVIANESYKDFVAGLQDEMAQAISNRPRQATPAYFTGHTVKSANDDKTITLIEKDGNEINFHLRKEGYIDGNYHLTPKYHHDRAEGKLSPMPDDLADFSEQIYQLVDALFDPKALEGIVTNANEQRINSINRNNLDRREFKALWNRINRKAVYQIQLDTELLVDESVRAIDAAAIARHYRFVEPLTYRLRSGEQTEHMLPDEVRDGGAFVGTETKTMIAKLSIKTDMTYDLLGNIAEETRLTRKTVARILKGLNKVVFEQFSHNPEAFIREVSRLINEQQARMLVQNLAYRVLDEGYPENEIFITNENIPFDSYLAQRHVWDYVVTDSQTERSFVEELEQADEVVVYAKLPDRFQIPTPFGGYTPDWAIAFKQGKVRHLYFIAETKGSMDESSLREIEKSKIDSAKKFFNALNEENKDLGDKVVYSVVDNYSTLMNIVK